MLGGGNSPKWLCYVFCKYSILLKKLQVNKGGLEWSHPINLTFLFNYVLPHAKKHKQYKAFNYFSFEGKDEVLLMLKNVTFLNIFILE